MPERDPGHLYAGAPDKRLAEDAVRLSRFRPVYRRLSEAEVALHDEIKDQAEVLAQLFERVQPGRYRTIAITALESAVMWAVKELTGQGME